MVSFSTWMQWLVFINQPPAMQHVIRRVLLVKASTSGVHFQNYGGHLEYFGRYICSSFTELGSFMDASVVRF